MTDLKSPQKKLKREAHIRTISLRDVRVSPTAQRELNTARVKKIANALDMERLGTLTVSDRDGCFWLIDGQHRFHALKEFWGEGWEDWKIEAWTYSNLTEAQEAQKFLEHNDVLTVNAFDKFLVGVTADDPVATDINRVVLSLGLKVSRNKVHGGIHAVTSLQKTYQRVGPGGLASTLTVIRDGFGDQGYEGVIIEGISLVLGRYENRIDTDRLVARLNSLAGGVKGLLNHANAIQERVGGLKSQCVAAAITEVYNRGARGQASIGSWWKDSDSAALKAVS